MAYIGQQKKAEIAADLKKTIPKSWKWSLAVRHHSTLVLTISAADVDLIGTLNEKCKTNIGDRNYWQLNVYRLKDSFDASEEVIADLFGEIKGVMMKGNHDNSDPMTDYFDVGWYVDINIGKWGKPFVCTTKESA